MAEAGLTERLQGRAERAGLLLAPALAARLAAYVALLLRWNERMNLTALGGDDQGLDRLVVEPLLAERRIPRGAAALVDIGSGGGSPAIPIRIARPRLVVRLVEARERKAAFLREAVRQLKLDGVLVEPCRYEELLKPRGAAGRSRRSDRARSPVGRGGGKLPGTAGEGRRHAVVLRRSRREGDRGLRGSGPSGAGEGSGAG